MIEDLCHEVQRAVDALNAACGSRRLPDWTYVIRQGSGLFKIGRSRNPLIRIRDLQASSGEMLSLVGLSHGGALETVLHRRFADRNRHGEWFDLEESPIPLDACVGCATLEQLPERRPWPPLIRSTLVRRSPPRLVASAVSIAPRPTRRRTSTEAERFYASVADRHLAGIRARRSQP